MKNLKTVILFLSTILVFQSSKAQVDARMFRHPDVSSTQITFVYGGDIWVVDKTGGTATRISSPSGSELNPRFSPDGSNIAFTGNYDGNADIYIIPASGGMPERLTNHPSTDMTIDWHPDGKQVLFGTSRESGRQRYNEFYLMEAGDAMPGKLPIPYGDYGTFSEDGNLLAYTPSSSEMLGWKRYEGGRAGDIWIFNLTTLEAENITNHRAVDGYPMWNGQKIFFLSNRGQDKRQNIWVYDTGSKSVEQITFFKDLDIHSPAIGPSDIVFHAGNNMYLLNLQSLEAKTVEINIVSDYITLKSSLVDASKNIQSYNVSPNGKRAVFEARGEIFTVPAEHGYIRNLTQSSGSRETYPAWSPDGKTIAYWSDKSGEYELYTQAADGSGKPEKISSFGPGFRYHLFWSPDSKKISFVDEKHVIYIVDIESNKATKVDDLHWIGHGGLNNIQFNWSPDNKWFTYENQTPNTQTAIFLYNLEEKKSYQVTSGHFRDRNPVFDPDGKYLYFATDRNLQQSRSSIDGTWIYNNVTRIAAVALNTDVASPLAPRNDEVEVTEEDKEEEDKEEDNGDKDKDEDGENKSDDIKIEIQDFERRLVLLPPKAGNYGLLSAVKGKLIMLQRPRSGSGESSSKLILYDLKERKEETIIENVRGYAMAPGDKKIIISQSGKYGIIDPAPNQKIKTPLKTSELYMTLNPREEWHQVLDDVWRKYRDFFHDPNMHGVDWDKTHDQYDDLVDYALTKGDVNFILQNLIGELNSSHTYVGGGETDRPKNVGTGMLGINWKMENGGWKIDHIVRGADWDHFSRSPFDEPGVNVNEGDYILAVNGIKLETDKEPYEAFAGLANKTVILTVNDKPSMDGSREVIIKTMSNEGTLRNLEWMENNRKRVEEATGGKVGYIYMPNTSGQGQDQLVRQFYAQLDKEGFIIDERFNSGGDLADRFMTLIDRPVVHYLSWRNGENSPQPLNANQAPKVMLINGWSGSGGDALPYTFQILGIGPVIGMRTAGALIGPAMGHQLIDGGFHTVPAGRIFGTDGKWFSEGHGVEPDIEVIDDPTQLAKGIDPQLERAIEEVIKLMKADPIKKVEHPPYEVR